MHASLIIMARRLRPVKTRTDYSRLKEQRDEKRKKDELNMLLNVEKVGEQHVDTVFYMNYMQMASVGKHQPKSMKVCKN